MASVVVVGVGEASSTTMASVVVVVVGEASSTTTSTTSVVAGTPSSTTSVPTSANSTAPSVEEPSSTTSTTSVVAGTPSSTTSVPASANSTAPSVEETSSTAANVVVVASAWATDAGTAASSEPHAAAASANEAANPTKSRSLNRLVSTSQKCSLVRPSHNPPSWAGAAGLSGAEYARHQRGNGMYLANCTPPRCPPTSSVAVAFQVPSPNPPMGWVVMG